MSIAIKDVQPIILAGGFGTRLKHVAPDTAKPMIPVEGVPFVEWIVRWLGKTGFGSATISTFHRAEQFEHHFRTRPVQDVSVTCVREPTPLGTGGAIRYAAEASKKQPRAWLVLNGDSMILFDLALLLAASTGDAAIVARHVPDASRYGTLKMSPAGRLTSFQEKQAANIGVGLINAGIYLIKDDWVRSISTATASSLEYDLLPAWLERGMKVDVLQTNGPFIDIGTEQTLSEAGAFIRQNMDHFR